VLLYIETGLVVVMMTLQSSLPQFYKKTPALHCVPGLYFKSDQAITGRSLLNRLLYRAILYQRKFKWIDNARKIDGKPVKSIARHCTTSWHRIGIYCLASSGTLIDRKWQRCVLAVKFVL